MTDDGLAGKLAKYRAQIIEAENSPEYWKAAYELLTAHTEAQAAEITKARQHCEEEHVPSELLQSAQADSESWKTLAEKANARADEQAAEIARLKHAFGVVDDIAVRQKTKADSLAQRLDVLSQDMAGFNDPPAERVERLEREQAEDRAAIRDANALNYGESAYFAWRDKHATALARAAVRDEGT